MSRRRTDPHRPGAIVPADYSLVLSYSLATSEDGWQIPAIKVNCELDNRTERKLPDGSTEIRNGEHAADGRCCVIGLRLLARVKFATTGGTGQCSVCGTRYVYGDVWLHEPTGEHIHIGHDCASKYELLADRSAWELENGRTRAAAATACLRARKAEDRAAFLAEHVGLADAFEVLSRADLPNTSGTSILRDLHGKFVSYCSLTSPQVALAIKLAGEIRNPPPEEKHVPAPEGRQSFSGRVVSIKAQDTAYGTTLRMTLKVETPEGSWLAWGTVPAAVERDEVKRGDTVELTATLTRGRDAHFALYKRPTGKILTRGA